MTTTSQVLLISLTPPSLKVLDDVRAAIASDTDVALVHLRPLGAAEPEIVSRVDRVHSLARAAEGHGPAFRRTLRGLAPPDRLYQHLAHDWFLEGMSAAQTVLVPLDPPARRAVQRLSEERGGLTVATPKGVAAALSVLALESTGGSASVGAPSSTRRPGAKLLLRAPGLGDEKRAALARELALDHLREGDVAAAERETLAVSSRITNLRVRADLLGDVTSRALHGGQATKLVREAAVAELAYADSVLGASPAAAAASFAEAARTAFHPELHVHHTESPLAADPNGFLAPFAESTTARRLAKGRRSSRPSRPRGSAAVSAAQRKADGADGRPTRVLLLTRGNANFLGEIERHLSDHPDFEVRLVDTGSEAPQLTRYGRDVTLLAERILTEPEALAEEVHAHLGEVIDWADVVHIEWCTMLSAVVPPTVPPDKRVVVRLHSYEAFAVWPHLVDFSAVDDLLLVSHHLRELAMAAVPALGGPTSPRLSVLPLALHLGDFARAKADLARHTLTLVGWHKVVKDPLWAFEVVRLLRTHDERFRLLLIGDDFEQSHSAGSQRYANRLWAELEELEAAGAVRRYGRTSDVPRALAEAGVILSTSVRESFHAGLVEGAASGAVPVVRDWPYFAHREEGARTLFPADWVVSTPREAAGRILEMTRDETTWRAAGAAAARHALSTWDWSAVRGAYEQFYRRG
jgi:glycosyltransferase involved in cell wall biosynthesis